MSKQYGYRAIIQYPHILTRGKFYKEISKGPREQWSGSIWIKCDDGIERTAAVGYALKWIRRRFRPKRKKNL